MMRLGLTFIISLFLTACATGTANKALTNAPQVKKYTKKIRNYSLRETKNLRSQNCVSAKIWQNMKWQQQLKVANGCLSRQQWSRVEEIANHLAQKDHVAPWGAYYLGLVAENKGNIDRAYWMNELALKKAPALGILFYQKGRLHWAKKEYEMAVQSFNKAIQLKSHIIEAHKFLGRVHLRDQEFGQASDHFQKVLKAQPSNAVALMGMAELNLRKQDTNMAIEYLTKLNRAHPKNAKFRLQFAEVLESEAEYEGALTQYKQALRYWRKKMGSKMAVKTKISNIKVLIAKSRAVARVSEVKASSNKGAKKN